MAATLDPRDPAFGGLPDGLEPALLRRRPRRALVALRPLVRRLLGQRRLRAGTLDRNGGTTRAAQERRFDGGAQQVPLRLAAMLPEGTVRLACPVSAVRQDAEGVHLATVDGPVRARRLVLAAPPEPLTALDWGDAVPPERLDLWRRMPMGRLMKVDAVYERPFWRDQRRNGFGMAPDGPVRITFDNTARTPGAPGVLLAFIGGGAWREVAPLSPDARRTAVLAGLARLYR